MHNRKWILIFCSLSVLYFSSSSLADSSKVNNEIIYGRYLTLKTAPTHEQIDIFSEIIQVNFSQKIKNCGRCDF